MFESSNYPGATKAQVELISYWASLQSGSALPSRDQLDPGRLRRYLSSLSIIDILPGNRMSLRLMGSNLRNLFGRDGSGRFVHELQEPFSEIWALGKQEAIGAAQPVWGVTDRGTDQHAWLRLPILGCGEVERQILCHDALISKQVMRQDRSLSSCLSDSQASIAA